MHFLQNSMFVLNVYFCRELKFVAILRSKLRFLLRNTGVDSDFTQNFWGKNWRLKALLQLYSDLSGFYGRRASTRGRGGTLGGDHFGIFLRFFDNPVSVTIRVDLWFPPKCVTVLRVWKSNEKCMFRTFEQALSNIQGVIFNCSALKMTEVPAP